MSEENKVEEKKEEEVKEESTPVKEESSSAKASDDADKSAKEVSSSTEAIQPTPEASADAAVDKEVPAKFKDLVAEIEKMSVLDLSELVKVLEDKFGVSAAPVAVAGAVAAGGGDAGGAEEKSSFDVELTGIGDNKIGVIKAVREITAKGLKDAKDMVEAAPTVIKEGAKKEEAEEIKKKIEEAGGSVNLK